MNDDPHIQHLQREQARVQARLKALQEFKTALEMCEGDLFSWVVNQELYGNHPGKELGLTVSMDGKVWFREDED